MKRVSVLLIFIILLFASTASAHQFSASYSKCAVDGKTVTLQFTLMLADLHNGPYLDRSGDGLVSEAELKDGVQLLFHLVTTNYRITAPDPLGAPLETTLEGYEKLPDEAVRLDIRYIFSGNVTVLNIASTMDRVTQPDHSNLFTIGAGDDVREAVIDANRPSIQLNVEGPSAGETVRDFVKLGVLHIFTGYDHIAFLVGLVIMTGVLTSLLKVVTSFTIAHSITLALATFQIVSLPSRLVESLIALSIAYVAIENFTGRTLVNRWKVAFTFGLVHGFGFSNVLREMELTRRNLGISLFSFNLGVEVGQLALVSVLFPLVIYLTATRWKEQVLTVVSLSIMCLGFYWFVQRAFLF